MNAFGASPSPFGQSLFGGSNGQQQSQQPQQSPFMQLGSMFGGNNGQQQGGFGGGYPQQQMQNPFMQSSGGGFGGGFGGFGQQQMPSYAQNYMSNINTGFDGEQGFGGFQQGGYGGGFGGGYGPMQGGYGGGQTQNPFMGGQGGFGGGYSPYQMQNPFMGGQGGGFGGGMGRGGYDRDRGFGGGYGQPQPAYMQDPEFQGYQKQQADLGQQMQDYMKKAPMYQQLQDLQGKMQGVQTKYAPQPMGGLSGLAGLLGGRPQFAQQMPYNPTGLYGGSGERPSYEQYVAENNRALASPTQEVKNQTMSRKEYESPVDMISQYAPYANGNQYRNMDYYGG